MPTGITAQEKTLIGVEATAGTGNVTTTWRGMGKIKDRREIVFPPEKIGIFGGTTRSYIPRKGSEVTLEAVMNYDQPAYIFNASIATATPTTDVGTSQIRTWTVASASTDLYATTDLTTLVVESGDNIGVEKVNYVFGKTISITGRQGEALNLTFTGEGRDPTTSASFTSVGSTDLDNPSESILFSMGKLYIDASSDTIGTTQVTETLLDMTLNFTTGWVALPAKDGRLDFSSIKRVDDEIVLDVSFEHNATAETEKNAWKSETERALQLRFEGSANTTTDTYDKKTFIIQLWGKWRSFGAEGLEEQDGDNIYRGQFRAAWSNTASNKAKFILVNETATLP